MSAEQRPLPSVPGQTGRARPAGEGAQLGRERMIEVAPADDDLAAGDSLLALRGPLMSMIVAPYLGAAAARPNAWMLTPKGAEVETVFGAHSAV